MGVMQVSDNSNGISLAYSADRVMFLERLRSGGAGGYSCLCRRLTHRFQIRSRRACDQLRLNSQTTEVTAALNTFPSMIQVLVTADRISIQLRCKAVMLPPDG